MVKGGPVPPGWSLQKDQRSCGGGGPKEKGGLDIKGGPSEGEVLVHHLSIISLMNLGFMEE